jgi:hypothetical protein
LAGRGDGDGRGATPPVGPHDPVVASVLCACKCADASDIRVVTMCGIHGLQNASGDTLQHSQCERCASVELRIVCQAHWFNAARGRQHGKASLIAACTYVVVQCMAGVDDAVPRSARLIIWGAAH